jgi:hypothetical protein
LPSLKGIGFKFPRLDYVLTVYADDSRWGLTFESRLLVLPQKSQKNLNPESIIPGLGPTLAAVE